MRIIRILCRYTSDAYLKVLRAIFFFFGTHIIIILYYILLSCLARRRSTKPELPANRAVDAAATSVRLTDVPIIVVARGVPHPLGGGRLNWFLGLRARTYYYNITLEY